MINRETIDKIFTAADIVEVISEYVNLKKSGQNFKGLSPFTNEKTPSFFVSPAKGIYKCFSSGKGGNAVSFLMEHEKLSYPEALHYLAKKYHIEIIEKELTTEEIQEKNVRESLIEVTSFANKKFQEWLRMNDEGKAIGASYLKERGFRDDIIEMFQLGYSLEQRDALTKTAIAKGFKAEYLEKTGLSVKRGSDYFDRFSGRVIFPIHGLSGQVIGFGGRMLRKDDKIAKYVNSPESELYHKSSVLYGLYFAKKEIISHDKCYLVEGYTDVMSMYQAGITNVAASSGTALTGDQIRLIKRFTKNITVIYDGDEAGIKASLRGIDLILEEGLNVKVLLLPEDEDPDSFSKSRSASEFMNFIKQNESDFIKFKTKLLVSEAENDPVKRATLITDIVRSIAMIPEGITRSVYIRECSKLMDISEEVLYGEASKLRRQKFEQKFKEGQYTHFPVEENKKKQTAIKEDQEFLDEKDVIRLLLNYGNNVLKNDEKEIKVAKYIVNEISNDDLEFQHPLYNLIYNEVKLIIDKGEEIDDKFFTNYPDNEVSKVAVNLLTPAYELSTIWERNANFIEKEEMRLKEIVPEIVMSYKNKKVLALIKQTQKEMKKAQEDDDMESISLLQQKTIVLNELKMNLSKNLGNRIIS